jgi:hypothetical protein
MPNQKKQSTEATVREIGAWHTREFVWPCDGITTRSCHTQRSTGRQRTRCTLGLVVRFLLSLPRHGRWLAKNV